MVLKESRTFTPRACLKSPAKPTQAGDFKQALGVKVRLSFNTIPTHCAALSSCAVLRAVAGSAVAEQEHAGTTSVLSSSGVAQTTTAVRLHRRQHGARWPMRLLIYITFDC
jgi:hypothetical protein